MADTPKGFDNGLTNYGDRDFARYLRRSFAKSMGYTDKSLDKPIVGHLHHRERLQQLPPAFPRADRSGETRRAGGGRACRSPSR